MRAFDKRIHYGLLAAALFALGACEGVESTLPSGTATVQGSAVEIPFDFSAARSTALYENLADGTLRLDLNFCELGCSMVGTEIDPGSRAVFINLRSGVAELVPGRIFSPATGMLALAVYRVAEPDTLEEAWQTKIEEAIAGELRIDTISLDGGAIRGSFLLQMQQGGVLSGEFDAPLLRLGDSAAP